MNPETLEEILSCPSIPSLPAVAVRVIEMTADPDLNLEDLAATIQNDQGLSTKILRTVNSSFYALRKKCSTIHQALVIMGMSSVKSLALGFSLVESVSDPSDEQFDYVSYWRRGLYTAVGAKIIASKAGKDFEDEAFLAGLLQDVGMIAIYRTYRDSYASLLQNVERDNEIVNVELGRYELTHCDIGSMLAARWKLPDQFVASIKYHHAPTAAPLQAAEIVRCVNLAGIAHDVLTDDEPTAVIAKFRRLCRDSFGLTDAQAEETLQQIADASVEMSSLFKLDTGRAADTEQILQLAQGRMVKASKESNVADEDFDSLLLDTQRTDPITGAMARAAFDAILRQSFTEAADTDSELSVLLVLVDNHERIAKGKSTEAADEMLIGTAALLKNHFEPAGAIVSRWADAVFAIVAPGCSRVSAVAMATEFRRDFQRAGGSWETNGEPATVSIGAAVLDDTSSDNYGRVEQLMAGAARALQTAKQNGGNAVRTFKPKAAA